MRKTKKTMKQVLTPKEVAALDNGKLRLVHIAHVAAHERRILARSPQCQRNKSIYEFAYKFVNQLRKAKKITSADKRHVRNLVTLLEEEVK